MSSVYKNFLYLIVGVIVGIFWSGIFSNSSINTTTELWSTEKIGVFSSPKAAKIYKLMEGRYYGFSDKLPKDIEDEFLRSMVMALWDEHSAYMDQKETSQFQESLLWDFEGIGAVIQEHPKGVRIVKVIDKSPAEKSGLRGGDIVVSVDGKDIAWLSTDEAVLLIRGPGGTRVNIWYLRDSETPLYVSVERDRVNIPSVSGEILTGTHIGYIEISTFGEYTTSEFYTAFNDLLSKWIKGLILDFRNNWWGYLDTAVDIASVFLPSDIPVVHIRENDPRLHEILYTRPRLWPNIDIPVVVLVNEFSASASEIFAWALQDHERAIIIGEKTYGKWSVQEPFDLRDGTLLKLTVAKWFTPKDRWIDGKGIDPDITVKLLDQDYIDQYDRQKHAAEKVLWEYIQSSSREDIIHKYLDYDFQ